MIVVSNGIIDNLQYRISDLNLKIFMLGIDKIYFTTFALQDIRFFLFLNLLNSTQITINFFRILYRIFLF